MKQFGVGFQVIHREGIVHSDLKPANFLIAGGFLKLIDFGIASAVGDDKTHVTKDNLIGTFNFMSPEAIQVTNLDEIWFASTCTQGVLKH